MAAQHVPPEGHDRGVTAGSGVFRMVDGVIYVDEQVSIALMATDLLGAAVRDGSPKLVADMDVVITAPWPAAARACG